MITKEEEILVCQHCLGDLKRSSKVLNCASCNIKYPISNNLIFMGYSKSVEENINKIISTEKHHQTDFDNFKDQYSFAFPSFQRALSAIQILKQDTKNKNPIALDIGCGGAPTGRMLSDNGFITYRCDLEPNSLFSGFQWNYSKNSSVKSIVCDSSILPFKDASVDVVFCKEFLHHIEDYDSLINEINRVLKKGGILLMIEPASKFRLPFQADKSKEHFGHYYQTIFNYFSALKNHEFKPYRYYVSFYRPNSRLKILNMLTFSMVKKYLDKQFHKNVKTTTLGFFFKKYIQRFFAGSNIIFSKKIKNTPKINKRPEINVVNPNKMTLDKDYLEDSRLDEFKKILDRVYQDILD